MAIRKTPAKWTWLTSLLALIVFLNLCALTWYFWAIPEQHFDKWKKILSTVGSWIGAILTFLGIRHKFGRQKPFHDVLRIRPLQLCIIAFTVLIWSFVLPFHLITISVRESDSMDPLSKVTVTVDDEKDPRLTISDATGDIKIGGLLATTHNLRFERDGYKKRSVTVSFVDVLNIISVYTVLLEKHDIPQPAQTYPITVFSDPIRASIYVNGVLKGDTITKIQLTAGEHTIEIRKPGYRTVNRLAIIPKMDVITVTLDKEDVH